MDKIEKIRQEIERLYNSEAPKHDQQCNFDDGYFTGIDAIAQFLDSLESEKPSEGLDDEIERYLPKIPENPYNEELRVFARHFAKWGAERQKAHMLKEAVPFYEILKAVPPGPERENVRIIIVKED